MKVSLVVWLTGLSGAGKSTIAGLARARLQREGVRVGLLDGDEIRRTVTRTCGFTRVDIEENNRAIAHLCREERRKWDLLLVTAISPFEQSRRAARSHVGEPFAHVYVKACLETAMQRDPKGLYRRAREGTVRNVIGYSADVPYEVPERVDLVLDTESESPEALAEELVEFVRLQLRSGVSERDSQGDIEEAFAIIRQATMLLAIDHARAGSSYFARVFDQHPEVLSLPYVAYFYRSLIDLAGQRRAIPGEEAFEYVTAVSTVSLLVNEPTPEIRAKFIRMGDDPDARIDRDVLRRVLRVLIRDRETVAPPDVIRSVYLAYALATGRPIHSIKYLLLNESVSSRDRALFDAAEKDSPQVRVIHLVRDPRANFASLRHQYVNQWRSMYPLDRFVRGENGFTWVWILLTTTRGADAMRWWKTKTDPQKFFTVRIEDLNLQFVSTLERLTRWLEVGWFQPWSSPEFVATSNGRPWRGVSAFSTVYQPFTHGPLPNDPAGSDRIPGPDREVTERWKKHLTPREIEFLEALYEGEMREHDYPFLFLGNGQPRLRALLNILFPLAGEIPPPKWYARFASGRDAIRKVLYPFCLPFAYVLSRLCFAFLYLCGEFRPSGASIQPKTP